jgi:hypothetical protein
MTLPKFPNVTVKLVGEDGNAFAILGKVMNALKAAVSATRTGRRSRRRRPPGTTTTCYRS